MSTFQDKPAIISPTKPMQRLFVSEPNQLPPEAPPPSKNTGTVGNQQSINPDKNLRVEQSSATLTAADPIASSTVNVPESEAMTTLISEGRQPNGSQDNDSATPKLPMNFSLQSGASGSISAESQKKAMASASPMVKTPTEASRRDAHRIVKKSSQTPNTRRGDTATSPRTANKASRSKPNSLAAIQKPQPLKGAAHSDTGFAKTKTKYTKPANIPSSLTAPTASSVSRGSAARQSLSLQSGNLRNLTAFQSSSRANLSCAPPAAHLPNRPKSAVSRPKPSVGLPSSKLLELDMVSAKRNGHVDEDFLARMMRPTQSSSSKTADKAPSTPSRKRGHHLPTNAASRHSADVLRSTIAKNPEKKTSEANGSQRGGSAWVPVDVKDEPSSVKCRGAYASHNSSKLLTPVDAQSVQDNMREAALDDRRAVNSSEADRAEMQVELRNTTSLVDPVAERVVTTETTSVETAEMATSHAQKSNPVQHPARLGNVVQSPCTSPLDDQALVSSGAGVMENKSRADIAGDATAMPDSLEPSRPAEDVTDDGRKQYPAKSIGSATQFMTQEGMMNKKTTFSSAPLFPPASESLSESRPGPWFAAASRAENKYCLPRAEHATIRHVGI